MPTFPHDIGHPLSAAEVALMHAAHDLAWVVLPGPGNGVLARPHTVDRHGGHWLDGHVTADGIDGLRDVLPGLRLDMRAGPGLPAGCLGLAW